MNYVCALDKMQRAVCRVSALTAWRAGAAPPRAACHALRQSYFTSCGDEGSLTAITMDSTAIQALNPSMTVVSSRREDRAGRGMLELLAVVDGSQQWQGTTGELAERIRALLSAGGAQQVEATVLLRVLAYAQGNLALLAGGVGASECGSSFAALHLAWRQHGGEWALGAGQLHHGGGKQRERLGTMALLALGQILVTMAALLGAYPDACHSTGATTKVQWHVHSVLKCA